MHHSRKPTAFTLIELLIVVAIIAILAAIAVPNFLEAQTRAKVSRAKADMRSLATGLEAYYVDSNRYPQCNDRGTAIAYGPGFSVSGPMADTPVLERLSTPIAYITDAAFRDAFSVKFRKSAATASAMVASNPFPVSPANDAAAAINSYLYQAVNKDGRATVANDGFSVFPLNATGWFLQSAGPDSTYYNLGGVLDNHLTKDEPILMIYDPSNGTISEGCIYRVGGSTRGDSDYAAGQGLAEAAQTAQ